MSSGFYSCLIILVFNLNLSTKTSGIYVEPSDYFKANCDPKCIFPNPPFHKLAKDLLSIFLDCTTICANIIIDHNTSFPEGSLKFSFRNVKKIFGSLKVSQTNFTTGAFLGGIEEIECDESDSFVFGNNFEMTEIGMLNLTRCACQFLVYQNPKMTRLNLPNLKNFNPQNKSIVQYIDMQIYDMPSEFCIDHMEMENFIKEPSLFMSTLPRNYCSVSNFTTSPGQDKICEFKENFTMQNLDSNCTKLIGNVTFTGTDQTWLYKLQSVVYLFGSLEISQTNLTTIEFPNLEYVASLRKEKPAIRLLANFNLTNFQLPKLKRVRAYQREWLRFEDMNIELVRSLKNQPQMCLPHYDILNETVLYETKIGPRYCGEFWSSCDEVVKSIDDDNFSSRLLEMYSSFVIITVMWIL